MKDTWKRAHRIKSGISLFVAFAMMLSVVAISGVSLIVSAATTTSGQMIYINMSQNSSWSSASSVDTLFTNASGSMVGTKRNVAVSGGVASVTAPSGATRLQFSSNSNSISEILGSVSTAVARGSHRIYLNASAVSSNDNASHEYTNPYVHYYGSASKPDTTWPGTKMNRIGSTSYYYVDVDESYTKLNFNSYDETNHYAVYQTSDLSINFGYSSDYACYDGSKWINPLVYVIDFADTVNNLDLYDRDTEYYVKSDNSIERSKYISKNGSNQDTSYITYKDVYVYNEAWNSYSTIYVTWDYNDPFETTVALNAKTENGVKVFSGKIPENASVRFHINQNDLKGASEAVTYPSGSGYGTGESTATYKITTIKQGWCKFSELNKNNYDANVDSNFSSDGSVIAVDATYFDYLSDEERTKGYLWNLAYNWTETGGKSEGSLYDWWYQFDDFNSLISSYAANNSTWKYPLYFGNMYGGEEHYSKYASKAAALTRFSISDNYFKAINNSSPMFWEFGNDKNYYQSLQGLAYPYLNSSGNIQAADGVEMPYFSTDQLVGTNYAKVFKGYFPFRAEKSGDVTTYSFDSKAARDNVYFTWNGHTPTKVNYGSGSTYGIYDALSKFGGSTDGYGIFPFNNTSATRSGKGTVAMENGVENLDYGFGIRLDIDFKVPANGTLDGTESGSPVTFNFTGDDDLWVYIGEKEDGSDGRLALDLGGDHKQASGSINFKTMQATADDVFADYGNTETITPTNLIPNGEFWVKTSEKDFCLYVWQNTSVSGIKNGNYLLPYSISGGYAKFRISDLGGNTECCFCKWQNINDGKLSSGNVNISYSNANRKAFNENGSTGTTPMSSSYECFDTQHSVTTPLSVAGVESGEKLNPNKTYHMTVFYMERGESESNFKVDFTMTPASNDLQVNKALDTGNVVSAIAKDLKNNENYNYSILANNENQAGKTYSIDGVDKTLSNESTFTLKDSNTADFNNTFKTGSEISINETLANNALEYTTTWELYDRSDGATIKSSSNLNESSTGTSFDLVNPKDASDYAQLNLDYINTIKTSSSLSLMKKVVSENDPNVSYPTTQPFDFEILIDLDGAGGVYSPKAYPVEYIINGDASNKYIAYNGKFTVQKDQAVTFLNIPVGATYSIKEDTYDNYKQYSVNGSLSGTVGENNSVITVTNMPVTNTTSLEIKKTLDGKSYTGEAFEYTVHGLSSTGGSTISTASEKSTATSASSGIVLFAGNKSGANRLFAFVDSGSYRYVITESKSSSLAQSDAYIMDGSIILVNIDYDSSDKSMTKTYYKVPANELTGVDTSSTAGTVFTKYFTNTYKVTGIAAFNNTVKKGSVTITKMDERGDELENVEFALIKVSQKVGSQQLVTDSMLQSIISNNSSPRIKGWTDENGEVKFNDLPIFEDGSGLYDENGWVTTSDNYTLGTATQQWYCLFEYMPQTSAYNPNSTRQYFTLPTNNKYDLTLEDVINSMVLMPQSSGWGFGAGLLNTGIAIIGSAFILGGIYYLYNHSQRRKRKARHIRND